MAYVDLNSIRASIAATPEESEFTSIYARIQALKPQIKEQDTSAPHISARRLMPFRDAGSDPVPSLPVSFPDYLQLVDWSGRAVRFDKRGAIDSQQPPILERMNIDPGVAASDTSPRQRLRSRAG
jgi:hypothetical protein